MRTRTVTAILTLLLAFGAVACDDTVEGIQEDAESIEDGIEEGADEATDE